VSKFTTILPTDTEEFIKTLPRDSFIHGIAFDMEQKAIVVLWECERFETGLTVPVHVTASQAKLKKFPAGVRDLKRPEPPILTPPPEKFHVEQSQPVEQPVYLTEDQVRVARAADLPVEFLGISSTWQPVDSRHVFTEGFYYRPVPKLVDKQETVSA
jgi:hypothetical protein